MTNLYASWQSVLVFPVNRSVILTTFASIHLKVWCSDVILELFRSDKLRTWMRNVNSLANLSCWLEPVRGRRKWAKKPRGICFMEFINEIKCLGNLPDYRHWSNSIFKHNWKMYRNYLLMDYKISYKS